MAPAAMGRFWTMLSHYHGQIWNASEVAASMGVAPNTARHYLDALEQTYLVRRLPPWHGNLGKRLVKAPKIYLRDSGLFHCLQGIETLGGLHRHPKLGASWEGFVLEEVARRLSAVPVYFFAIHSGSELDLFFEKDGVRTGIEIKWSDAPKLTRSMRIARQDLRLDRLLVVYPGERSYVLDDGIEVVGLREVAGRV
jgi:predicted AAA+ superfamily ATPase